jgi:hypothetical protein
VDEEVTIEQELKITRASHAGVPLQKIADYLGLTLEQVEAVIAIDQQLRKAQDKFTAWIEANKGP